MSKKEEKLGTAFLYQSLLSCRRHLARGTILPKYQLPFRTFCGVVWTQPTLLCPAPGLVPGEQARLQQLVLP